MSENDIRWRWWYLAAGITFGSIVGYFIGLESGWLT